MLLELFGMLLHIQLMDRCKFILMLLNNLVLEMLFLILLLLDLLLQLQHKQQSVQTLDSKISIQNGHGLIQIQLLYKKTLNYINLMKVLLLLLMLSNKSLQLLHAPLIQRLVKHLPSLYHQLPQHLQESIIILLMALVNVLINQKFNANYLSNKEHNAIIILLA